MATRVNIGTKKAEELIYDFNRKYYKGTSLYDVYQSCSMAKAHSWEQIKSTCNRLNGWNLHITGAGSHNYSCMYAFNRTDEETGEIIGVTLRKETKGNTYDLELTTEEYDEMCIPR